MPILVKVVVSTVFMYALALAAIWLPAPHLWSDAYGGAPFGIPVRIFCSIVVFVVGVLPGAWFLYHWETVYLHAEQHGRAPCVRRRTRIFMGGGLVGALVSLALAPIVHKFTVYLAKVLRDRDPAVRKSVLISWLGLLYAFVCLFGLISVLGRVNHGRAAHARGPLVSRYQNSSPELVRTRKEYLEHAAQLQKMYEELKTERSGLGTASAPAVEAFNLKAAQYRTACEQLRTEKKALDNPVP